MFGLKFYLRRLDFFFGFVAFFAARFGFLDFFVFDFLIVLTGFGLMLDSSSSDRTFMFFSWTSSILVLALSCPTSGSGVVKEPPCSVKQ
jgi:hypothetical protein